jgi:hypothetical protein
VTLEVSERMKEFKYDNLSDALTDEKMMFFMEYSNITDLS